MDLLKLTWEALAQVKSIEGTSTSFIEPKLVRKSQVTVSVEKSTSKSIHWIESGNWLEKEKRITFTNHYHWQLKENSIALSHLRQGEKNETQLRCIYKKR